MKNSTAALASGFAAFLSVIYAQTSVLLSVMHPGHALAADWRIGIGYSTIFVFMAFSFVAKEIRENGYSIPYVGDHA